MAVRIRMKRMGRRHRPFFRICATDSRAPRDGKVIEEIGYYDPMVPETDARAVLNKVRIDYWLSVGAQPSDRVGVLIKKYGTNGSHLAAQTVAFAKLKIRPAPPEPMPIPLPVRGAPATEDSAREESTENGMANTESGGSAVESSASE